MRTFKGLENIHSVIDMHVAEWRKEQGEPEEEISELSLEENVRRRLTTGMNPNTGTGRFSADRFLGAKPKKQKKFEAPEPKLEEVEEIEADEEPEVEIKSVIKHPDDKPHSWLYNEVVKAINDSAKGLGKNTKIVAIFIPVVQNGKEFEDLPVNEIVTLPPVNEEAVKIEEPEEVTVDSIEAEPEPEITEQESETQNEEPENNEADFDLLPEGPGDNDTELADAFHTMEEKLDESLQAQDDEEEQEAPAELELVEPELEEEIPEQPAELIPEPEIESEEEDQEPATEIEEQPEVEETEIIDTEPEDAGEVMPSTTIEDVANENENISTLEDVEIIDENESEEEPKLLPLPDLPDGLDDDEVYEEDETEFEDPLAVSNRINELSGLDSDDELITLEENDNEERIKL